MNNLHIVIGKFPNILSIFNAYFHGNFFASEKSNKPNNSRTPPRNENRKKLNNVWIIKFAFQFKI
jgi:hypothetical protein